MIRLFTGLPGSFKTCRATRVIREAVAQGRPVFVSNLEGLNIPGVQIWENPRDWQSLPTGALLVVDEAQKFWRTSRTLEIPPEIQALETHRHLGIDFLLTTQQPGYLLKHLRGLVGEHVHHIRKGKMRASTLTWNRCCEDLTSTVEAKKADAGIFIATPEDFTGYVSTVKDTHKARFNRRYLYIGVAVAAIAFALYFVASAAIGKKDKALAQGATEESQAAQPAGVRGPSAPQTVEQYLAKHQPRIAGAPFSAPIYDERKPLANPELYCIASEAGLDAQGKHVAASAHCITEQGTAYAIAPAAARQLVKTGGIYNPYKAPQQPQAGFVQQPGAGQSPAMMAAPVAAPVDATPQGSEQVASYGAFRRP